MQQRTFQFPITRVNRGLMEYVEDTLVTEFPFTIYFNQQEMVTLLCTPEYLEELAVGFLTSEGLLHDAVDVTKLELDADKGTVYVEAKGRHAIAQQLFLKRFITTGCGRGTSFYNGLDSTLVRPPDPTLRVSCEQIFTLMRQLQDRSALYRSTGGVHSAALAAGDELLFFREDVGRHNAVDKIFGRCLLDGIELENKIMLSSGRVSSEILLKAAKRGIGLLVSRSAPTELAVRLAEQLGITVVGFVRGSRMNIYTHGEKVTE